jgi:cytochrome P450
MQRAFTPRRVAELEPFIERSCHELIDELPAAGEFDLMASYANALPLRVITRVLGFAPEQAPMLREWTEDFLVMATPAGEEAAGAPSGVDDAARIERMLGSIDEVLALIDARRWSWRSRATTPQRT